MRTPGHDLELVHGLLHAEGVIAEVADVLTARYCAGADETGVNSYNVLDLRLAPTATPAVAASRHVVTSSACGICGTTSVEAVMRQSRYRLEAGPLIDQDLIATAPTMLREAQRNFAQTGGVHAAGLLARDRRLLCVREDVGRHNAVDKVIGWALREGRLPLSDVVLVVSGRASYELTQKAVLAGIGVLAAVSAPSSLAVDLAQDAGLTLVGFVRDAGMNVYTHPDRILVRATTTREPV